MVVVTLPLITVSVIVASCLLIRNVMEKFANHPRANSLLLSTAFAAILANLGALALFFWNTRAYFISISDPQTNFCALSLTRRGCNLLLSPTTLGIAIFNFSLFALVLERALLVRRVIREVSTPTILPGSFDAAATSKPRCCPGLRGNIAIVALIWLSVAAGATARLFLLQDPHALLHVCTIHTHRALLVLFISSSFMSLGNIFSFFLALWTLRVCQNQLANFAVAQAQISLNSRVDLRFTIGITQMLYPTLIFGSVWQLMSNVSFLAAFVLHSFFRIGNRDSRLHRFALLQQFQALFLAFPPMLFFAVMALYRKLQLDREGASLFIRLSRPQDEQPTVGPTILPVAASQRRPPLPAELTLETSVNRLPPTQQQHVRRIPTGNKEAQLRFTSLTTAWNHRLGGSPARALKHNPASSSSSKPKRLPPIKARRKNDCPTTSSAPNTSTITTAF